MENIFENAKFGDKFKTRDGRMAVFFAFERYNKNTAYFIIDPRQRSVENTHMTLLLTYDGYYTAKCGSDIVSRWEESINEEELDKLAEEYSQDDALCQGVSEGYTCPGLIKAFKAGYRKAK